MARRSSSTVRKQGDFHCEEEIARRLSQDPHDWPAKAVVLERDGFPRVDPIMGGRFWPAVRQFFLHRYGVTTLLPFNPDGEENLDAL